MYCHTRVSFATVSFRATKLVTKYLLIIIIQTSILYRDVRSSIGLYQSFHWCSIASPCCTCFGTVCRFFCSVALFVQTMHYRLYSRGSFETFTRQVPELPDQKPAQGVHHQPSNSKEHVWHAIVGLSFLFFIPSNLWRRHSLL